VREFRSSFLESGLDDLETPSGLAGRVAECNCFSIRANGRCAGDRNVMADADSARYADTGLVRAATGNKLTRHADFTSVNIEAARIRV
jgi:hypothetical protein